MIGETVSHYKILEKLGEGGMGVVYKAEDTKLKRNVALKFLTAHLSASEHDKARFVQEAQAASALNHPNVCTIHDIQEHDGQMFIVMEFVEGQTLREKRGTISYKQAIDIGIQIAEGLAAAHEKGIVHRDIKPENIMIRKDGITQIMDFGLAKLRASGSKITRLTKEGSTVGTAGYMSPEQVQGQDTDHRSDIFAYGVLLYELLTGQQPFKGVHETALAYEIVNVDAPPMSSIKQEIDPALDVIVLGCLEKDPRERTQSMAQTALDLKRFRRESSKQRLSRSMPARPAYTVSGTGQPVELPEPVKARSSKRELIAWSLAGILFAAVLYLMLRPSPPPSVAKSLIRSSVITPDSIYIHSFGAGLGPPVISPDGRRIAFIGVTPDGSKRIYVHSLEESETRALPGTEGAGEPFWSPDGKMVGFLSNGKLKKIDLVGGSPISICDDPNPRGGTWNRDGTIVFAPDFQSGLYRVSADGKGAPEQITSLDSTRHEGSHRWPFFLPDGKHFLYMVRTASETGQAEGDAVFVAALDGSMKKMLVQSSFNASFANGYLLFARSSVLLAQKFDPEALSLEGDPIKLQEGLLTDVSYNMAVFTVSQTGALLYETGQAEAGARPLFVDRTGKVMRTIEDRNEQDQPRFSPDGKQVALYLYDTKTRRSNIWTYDLRTGSRRRLTTGAAGDFLPCWSADGSQIYYTSGDRTARHLYEIPVTHATGERNVLSMSSQDIVLDCSPDGKTLLVGTNNTSLTAGDLWLLPASGNASKPVPFQQTNFNESWGRISRDGKWVAFVSDESGDDEVYLKPLSSPASEAWKVSNGGGENPLWGPNSNELIYANARGVVVSATLRFSGNSGEVVSVKPLFAPPPFSSSYDISPDGKTFIITRNLEMQKFPPLSLVMNWDEAIKKK